MIRWLYLLPLFVSQEFLDFNKWQLKVKWINWRKEWWMEFQALCRPITFAEGMKNTDKQENSLNLYIIKLIVVYYVQIGA